MMNLLFTGRAVGLGPIENVLLWTMLGREVWAIWSTSVGASVETKLTQSSWCGKKTGLAVLGLGTRLLIKCYESGVR